MTKKDYVLKAKAISDGQLINCASQADVLMNAVTRSKIARQLAESCAAQNPRFDRARFLAACGVNE